MKKKKKNCLQVQIKFDYKRYYPNQGLVSKNKGNNYNCSKSSFIFLTSRFFFSMLRHHETSQPIKIFLKKIFKKEKKIDIDSRRYSLL